jgi:hypothetical protein
MKVRQELMAVLRNIFFIIIFFSFLSGPLLPSGKKIRVIAEKANIYFKADKNSPIVETVAKGTILTLQDTGKVKKLWLPVYFASEESGMTISGYILDALVERLFVVTKIVTIKGEDESREDKYKFKNYFRETRWGMSKNQVFELEGESFHQEKSYGSETIRYQKKVIGLECSIEFIFAGNKLIKAKYIFLGQHKHESQYIGDYKKIKDWLTEMHGMPLGSNVTWRNDLYKEDYSNWGLAVSLGHLEYSSLWKNQEMEIFLTLSGENNKLSLRAEYKGLRIKK